MCSPPAASRTRRQLRFRAATHQEEGVLGRVRQLFSAKHGTALCKLSRALVAQARLCIRGRKARLGGALADLNEVEIKAQNQAVRRGVGRHPADFMLQRAAEEAGR